MKYVQMLYAFSTILNNEIYFIIDGNSKSLLERLTYIII
uniref:Uncharacterized protein n=1 Tax=Heterorhabditis bacteriophora TaxID=37862 RepID=A0A1I7WKF4_HETBA